MQKVHESSPLARVRRRDLLRAGLMGLAGVGLVDRLAGTSAAARVVKLAGDHQFKVNRIDRIPVEVPFRQVPERNMARELPHWKYFEIFEVELHSGQVGYGETMLWYTHHAPTDDDVKRALGRNAIELLWDDSLGSGLQMALFDAVGRAAGVPIHSLFGDKVHDRTSLSWWDFDMPAEDWATECQEALRLGYTAFKTSLL